MERNYLGEDCRCQLVLSRRDSDARVPLPLTTQRLADEPRLALSCGALLTAFASYASDADEEQASGERRMAKEHHRHGKLLR